jgi:diguanylate cyclase (GGDEF)-like protein
MSLPHNLSFESDLCDTPLSRWTRAVGRQTEEGVPPMQGEALSNRQRGIVPLRAWAVWSLPPGLRAYVLTVASAWALVTVAVLLRTPFRPSDLMTFAILTGCALIALEATKRQGETTGMVPKDMAGAWLLPLALVLPPAYSLVAPIALMVMTQCRVKWSVPHRRVFTVASTGLANAAVAVAVHRLPVVWNLEHLRSGGVALLWGALALAGAAAAFWLNHILVSLAVKATAPEESWREILLNREEMLSDLGESCTGAAVGLLCLLNPGLALLGLVPVILLQRALLHDQLTAAARLDAKTRLLNGPTWEREATREIARAVRTGTPLSVMLLDLDHFKEVNDRFGHLAGDEILKSVAEAMRTQTREYDEIARFGGDEFAVLLPQSDLVEATRTAERIRRRVADIAVSVNGAIVRTSVSIGVAELSSRAQGVTDLLAAADLSLYRAKESRDQVHSALHDDLSFPRDL